MDMATNPSRRGHSRPRLRWRAQLHRQRCVQAKSHSPHRLLKRSENTALKSPLRRSPIWQSPFPDRSLVIAARSFGALIKILSANSSGFDPDRLVNALQSRTAEQWGHIVGGLRVETSGQRRFRGRSWRHTASRRSALRRSGNDLSEGTPPGNWRGSSCRTTATIPLTDQSQGG